MKALLICTTSDSVCTFRVGFIKTLQSMGYKVFVVAFDDKRKDDIENLGTEFYCVADKNRNLNPLSILSLKNKYKKIINKINPNFVFTFMLKPNIFGVLAAKSVRIKNIYSMVEGAGDVFINNGLSWQIIRKIVCFLYKIAFKNSKKVIFLNTDDKEEFIRRKLVKEEQCEIIPGVGVDLKKFAYKPLKNSNKFLMVARLLNTKGVYEYCECARIVKQKYPETEFNYLGGEGTVKCADLKEYIDNGIINYLGTTTDVRPYYENCTVFVLPSYREGMPMSIMEAEATGRAIITTDVSGCKDTVLDGFNGFIIPCKDHNAMVEKIIWCINNPTQVVQMGLNSRKLAEEKFDQTIINEMLIKTIIKMEEKNIE